MKVVSYISWASQNEKITDEGIKVLSKNIGKMSELRQLNLNLE